MAWKEKRPLTKSDWNILDGIMQDGMNPNDGFSATGFHYTLSGFLRQFGYRTTSRYEAWEIAKELWELTPIEDDKYGWN